MKNRRSRSTSWSDLPYDMLVKIFMGLNVLDLVTGVSRVCSAWRTACFEPALWKKIDLSVMQTDSIEISTEGNAWPNDPSSIKLMLLLRSALNFSRGNVTCLIFHFYVFLKSEFLLYAAMRSQNLKRLVLPAWNQINVPAFEEAITYWKDLESLTIPCVHSPCNMMKAVGTYCKNFCELKIMCPFDIDFAKAIVTHTPQLKVLSLRCTVVYKEALVYILNNLPHLEILNLSHSLMVDDTQQTGYLVVFQKLDDEVTENASMLKNFLTCQNRSCSMCKTQVDEEEFFRWYDYEEEELWRTDEIPSLAL